MQAPTLVLATLRSVCVAGSKHAGDGICVVAVPKSLPGSTLLGEPPTGAKICALLGRSQPGGTTGFFIWARTKKCDDQPGGTLMGTALMLQVSTGPACPHVHGPKVLATALTPSVSLTVIGPEYGPGPAFC